MDAKYTLSDKLWSGHQRRKEEHKQKGNGFGFGLAKLNGVTRTLSARYYKDGSEILIPQEGKNPRRLTPKECARLMGFSKKYQNKIVVSDLQAYRQFGNAIVPKVAKSVVKQVLPLLQSYLARIDTSSKVKAAAANVIDSRPNQDKKWQHINVNGL